MTDATLTVTQSALEAFAREYFETIGATIDEASDRWTIQVPNHIGLSFTDEPEFEVIMDEAEGDDEDEYVLSPESDFSQRLFDEASTLAPNGHVVITHHDDEQGLHQPSWLRESDLELEETKFRPYYDRAALFALVNVGVETVSEFQTQFLEATVVDTGTGQEIPRLAETTLTTFFDPLKRPNFDDYREEEQLFESLDLGELQSLLDLCQENALDRIDAEITRIRRSATRSARTEFDEYRQFKEQELNDIREEIDSISHQLQRLADKADEAESNQERVKALNERRDLQSDLDNLETKRDDILEDKQDGFESKRAAIFDRHALELSVSIVALTKIEYESGEMELVLRTTDQTDSITVPYGAGSGVIGSVRCPICDQQLTGENYLVLDGELGCVACQS